MLIKNLSVMKILNSNSNFTVQVKLTSERGVFRGSSPAGESNSKYEVDPFKSEIDDIVSDFNGFLDRLSNKRIDAIDDVYKIEKLLPEKFVGGPSLSLSYALVYGLSASLGVEPYSLFGGKNTVLPICKMLGGGLHASGLGMDIQEILAVTIDKSVGDSITGTLKTYKNLKEMLRSGSHGYSGGVDPEGGFVTGLDNYESLKIASAAVDKTVKETGLDIRLGIDVAASTFCNDGKYTYTKPIYSKKTLNTGEQVDLVVRLAKEFNLYYIEDPVDQTDIEGYGKVLNATKALVVGDDVTATKTERLRLTASSISAALVKPNQVGLLHQVKAFSDLADKFKLTKVVSHRSEETNIPMISDIAIGLGAKYLKVGINRGERVEKINRLMEIK